MIWSKGTLDGYEVWTGRTAAMEMVMVPELGSRVISLRNRRTGREWLTQPGGKLERSEYASSFGNRDGSGWDEMFPTINPCRYPAFPWEGAELPDHGEVWSIPWEAYCAQEQLHCSVQGIRIPYQLRKTYSFPREDCLRIDYAVHNPSPFPFSFLWAAHPLFQIEEGMEIIVPEELREIIVSYSAQGRLGETGAIGKWPKPLEERPDIRLNRTGNPLEASAEKFYFTGELPDGRASIYDPVAREGLGVLFPKEQVPYLSIWANYGGYQGQYHLAIEPATGLLDDLSYAMGQSAVAEVPAGGTYTWHLEMCWI
ncbi:hypothetical protein JCM10914A_01660 [Paenibacillus sp. JCM 10914]|uniref:hypothetical protein n=1 Tax=Paenibacillus sp. JCM 10914 TaxID=1236974 RepID=UPI0003CC9B80|nr:hypothetical protein [Paenibacillus sp. JCM 10914]GAE06906.1 hypothetical protein JCM10914_3098 [Paenibacillus sp. JCM 10914]